MKRIVILSSIVILSMNGCVKDDILDDMVPERIMILNPLTSIEIGSTYQFQAEYFNNVGMMDSALLSWTSEDTSIVQISAEGLATAKDYGTTRIEVKFAENNISESFDLEVSDSTITVETGERTGTLKTTSSYDLEGNFKLNFDGTNFTLEFDESYVCDQGLPGAYIYLTNNPSTNNQAFEVGEVEQFSGAYTISIPSSSDLMLNSYDYVLFYCKPFNVKVGDGKFEN
ncbi:MAG: DM13 domain-containing protein [Flavobacteriales bacterium]|nr:DM13 domain-containing protein [Flavobacteriales bacterium]